ncbi:MAG TPA: branched-chain amino acid ABC transporter permease [Ruminococcaceae bacterium]|nr:branched-chain amino acid ABC transporter permease [Oscillospiraceae bacterium]
MVVAAALVLFTVLYEIGALRRSDLSLLLQAGYSMVLAVSLNLVVGFLGELSLGHAGFMCVGAYLGSYVGIQLSAVIPNKTVVLLLSMLVGGLLAAVFGLIIGLPALRLKGDYLAIVTLAFGEIVRTVFKNIPIFGGAIGLNSSSIQYGKSLFIVAFLVVLFTLFISQNLIRSKHGRAVTAIRDNEIAARAMGINVTYYKLLIFVVAAFFAGIAGVLYGASVNPISYKAFDYNYSIEILVMVVLGGMGNISGSMIAAALLTFINVKLTALGGDLAAIKYLIYALILIVMVMFNNAPMFKGLREKVFRLLDFSKLKKKGTRPEVIKDDKANWTQIPTKIKMDAVLSTDITADDTFEPDKPQKGGEDR